LSGGVPHLALHNDVASALAADQPVVALESTIISHGMPWPKNVETARQVEADIRAGGAVPATIAVLDGMIHVGLSDGQLDHIAQADPVMKLSRADLAFAVAERRTGATTVAATMMVAHMAGIEVFATGGIGGVHRGAEIDLDISADLHELGRTPVTVIAGGAKAILDIPKTLEVLETQGVPVVAYGQDNLPAFWSRDSGLKAPLRLDTPSQIAGFMAVRKQLGAHGGMLIANPVPAENEIPQDEMSVLIKAALGEAGQRGIAGKDVTPFLLTLIAEMTQGRSLETNIALVRANARLAAEIAVALV